MADTTTESTGTAQQTGSTSTAQQNAQANQAEKKSENQTQSAQKSTDTPQPQYRAATDAEVQSMSDEQKKDYNEYKPVTLKGKGVSQSQYGVTAEERASRKTADRKPWIKEIKRLCDKNGGVFPYDKFPDGRPFLDPATNKPWTKEALLKEIEEYGRTKSGVEVPFGERGSFLFCGSQPDKPRVVQKQPEGTPAATPEKKNDTGGILAWLARNWGYLLLAAAVVAAAAFFIFKAIKNKHDKKKNQEKSLPDDGGKGDDSSKDNSNTKDPNQNTQEPVTPAPEQQPQQTEQKQQTQTLPLQPGVNEVPVSKQDTPSNSDKGGTSRPNYGTGVESKTDAGANTPSATSTGASASTSSATTAGASRASFGTGLSPTTNTTLSIYGQRMGGEVIYGTSMNEALNLIKTGLSVSKFNGGK